MQGLRDIKLWLHFSFCFALSLCGAWYFREKSLCKNFDAKSPLEAGFESVGSEYINPLIKVLQVLQVLQSMCNLRLGLVRRLCL